MKSRSITCRFHNRRHLQLDGRLDLPTDSKPKAWLVFCHCFTCSKETITTYRLSRHLAAAGYGVLRFDFSGLGGSEGDFADTTFSGMQDDLRSAIDFLAANYQAPDFLLGHSLGGTTALSLAQETDSVQGVVAVAAPSRPEHVLHHFGHALPLLEQGISASFEVAGQFFDIHPAFVEDVRRFDMQTVLSQTVKPALIIHIENDALVDEKNAEEIQKWLKGKSTRLDIQDSDHLLSQREASQEAAEAIITWLQKNAP